MKQDKFILPISIIIGCIILGGFYYISQLKKDVKNKEIDFTNYEVNQEEKDKKIINIPLYFNKSTGELYPTENIKINKCIWNIWGDHGSDLTIVTDTAFISEQTNEYIKINKFLPPRVPIYVTCIDFENNVYQGSIQEYK